MVMDDDVIKAKEIIGTKSLKTISGSLLGAITMYDNGVIVIEYKYGLRKADLFYCEKGNGCNTGSYSPLKILESTKSNPHKNTEEEIKTYTYIPKLNKDKEYGFKIEAYFGVNSAYKGTESIKGSPTISSKQVLDVSGIYIKATGSDIADEEIGGLMEKIKSIVNEAVLPILYWTIGIFLVIKGAILGTQIVKSADEPNVRLEKVRALKWLVIGVGIAFAASSLVGVITGYFKGVFN